MMTQDELWTHEADRNYRVKKQLNELAFLNESLEKRIDQMERSLSYMRQSDEHMMSEEEPQGPGTYVLNDEGELVFQPD